MNLPPALRLLIAIWLANLLPAGAAPGDLDPSFGTGGVVTTDFSTPTQFSDFSVAEDVAVQADGKLVVVGAAHLFPSTSFAVVRYLPDGTLDPGFHGDGKVLAALNGEASKVVVQADGKILVVGRTDAYDFGLRLLRFNPDGTPDTSFNGTGIVQGIDLGPYPSAPALAVQADGKIVVAAKAGNESVVVLLRYLPDGRADTSFDGGGGAGAGTVRTQLQVEHYTEVSLALQDDGRMLVAGTTFSGTDATSYNFLLARFQANGAPDLSFHGGGGLTTDLAGGSDYSAAVKVQSDGKIVVAGSSDTASSNDLSLAAVRYTAAGRLDQQFDQTGIAVSPTTYHHFDFALSMALQPDGKILVAGRSYNEDEYHYEMALARFEADGEPDLSFGGTGKITTTVGYAAQGYGLAVQPDGRIVQVGFSEDGSKTLFTVVRYLGAPEPVPDLIVSRGQPVPGEAEGVVFGEFGPPAVDAGQVGGTATILRADGGRESVIFGGDLSTVLVREGQPAPGGERQSFTALEDPVFGAGGFGFAGWISRGDGPHWARGLWTQFPEAPMTRVAICGGEAAGVHGGVFADFPGFGLPREQGRLIYLGLLRHEAGVSTENDFGVWRQCADGGSDLLLRNGSSVNLAGGGMRRIQRLRLMIPVPHVSDQRRSFAPDGGVMTTATFSDGDSGLVRVGPDNSVDVPLETGSLVPGLPGAKFVGFGVPSSASGGRYALLARLGNPQSEAIVASLKGAPELIAKGNDPVPGFAGLHFESLGHPLLGESGAIGWLATLGGPGVTRANRSALVFHQDGQVTVAARLGDAAPDAGADAVFQRFLSVIVTDTLPARLVFTATLAGPGVSGQDHEGVWCFSPESGLRLILRAGEPIDASGEPRMVRSFEALQANPASNGQGRSADASGFVAAKVKLSDGRSGVIRIPLP